MPIEPLENEYPAFEIPLTAQQLADLGIIAVLWGQVDFITDELLLYAFKIAPAQSKALLGDKQIGSRIDLLSNHLAGLKPKAVRALAQRFCSLVQKNKTARNTAFHGAWGWELKRGTPPLAVPAARTSKAPKNLFYPSRFEALREDLTYASRIGWEAVCLLRGWEVTQGAAKLTFGQENGPDGGPPLWLRKPGEQPDPGRPPQGRRSAAPKRPPKQPRQESQG